MKGAVCGLFASTLLLAIAASHEARAAEKTQRVVVEKFSGPGTMRFRSMVLAVLAQRGADVVAIEKVTSTEADLGLLQVSDNYAAVGKELKVSAFFGGTISGKGRKVIARLRGTSGDGKSLGQAAWSAKNLKLLFGAVGATLSKKMAGMLSGAPAKVEEVADEPEPSGKAGPVAAAEADSDDAAPRGKRKAADSDDDPPPRSKRKAAADDESVSASADDEGPPRTGRAKLDVAFGAHVYRRDFNYNDNIRGGQQAYKLPAVPAPALTADYFFLPNFGATAGGEYSVALISQDGVGNKYKTSSLGYFIGGKARTFLSNAEVAGHVAYAVNSFKVTPEAGDTSAPQVAGVLYEQVRIGGSGRLHLNEKTALIGGGSYLHILSMGQIRKEYFPNATGRGGEGYAGLAFALSWMKGLEGRITADLRRYVFAMHPQMADTRVAGGAVDQYIGLNLGVGYRN
jgi:hypothetical protein